MLVLVLVLALVLVLEPGCASNEARPAGPRFGDAEVDFEGNDTLWRLALAPAIGDFEDRPLSPATIADAAFALERYYASRGFPFARVEGFLERGEDGGPRARFRIEEGPRPRVRSVAIEGARRFSGEDLRAQLEASEHRWYAPSHVVEDRLDDDASRIRDRYVRAGYPEARVEPAVRYAEARDAADVSYRVVEGRHFAVAGVAVTGNASFAERALVSATAIVAGADYYPRRATEARDAVERFYRDRGFAFAAVDVAADVDRRSATARLRVTVTEGPLCRFGQVQVRGNERTVERIIAREVKAPPWAVYSHAPLREAERRLYELGIFDRVSIRTVPKAAGPGRADVIVDVTERPAGLLRAGIGWGSWDQLRGQVAASYANLFGRGIQVDARAVGSFKGYEVGAGLRDPSILGSRARFDLDGYHQDRDVRVYTIRRDGGTAFLSYPMPLGFRPAIGIRLDSSKVRDEASGAAIEDRTIDLVSAIVRLTHDGRDDPLFPSAGSFHEVAVEEAGLLALGDADFSRLTAGATQYWSPLPRLTLAASLHAGVIFPHERGAVPIQERFFLGGESSLRGFVQNEVGAPSGGNVFVLGSLEPRIQLYGPVWMAVFADAGGVFADVDEVAAGEIRVTPGVGLRVRTPIGPLRLDVGFKADRRAGESLAEASFAVGYPF